MPIRPENRDRYPTDWAEISRSIKEDYDREHHAQTRAEKRRAETAGLAGLFDLDAQETR